MNESSNQIQVHTYTGREMSIALEQHYKALSTQINKIKLHNNRLSNPSLVKSTALNALTFGEYKRIYTLQKSLTHDPEQQNQCRQQLRAIENKYCTHPYILELVRETKAIEGLFGLIITINNKSLSDLDRQVASTLAEKRKLSGRETEMFKTLSDKIIDIPTDALYQSQFMHIKQERKMSDDTPKTLLAGKPSATASNIIELAKLEVKRQIQLAIESKDDEPLHGPRMVGESITTDINGYEIHLEYVARGINSDKETRFHWEREGLESSPWVFKGNWYTPEAIDRWARKQADEENVPKHLSAFTWTIDTAEAISDYQPLFVDQTTQTRARAF